MTLPSNMKRIREQRARQRLYERGRIRLIMAALVFAACTVLWVVIW